MCCPLCRLDECDVHHQSNGITEINCVTYGSNIRLYFSCFQNDREKYQKAINLSCEFLVKQPSISNGQNWSFSCLEKPDFEYDKYEINLYPLLHNYPQTMTDTVERTLLNLSYLYPSFGEIFVISDEMYNLCFPKASNDPYEQVDGILSMLVQMGYLTNNNAAYSISAEGWKKIDSIRKEQKEIRQGFVAMQFGADTAEIREGFRQAISDAGYLMRAIDEKEHNNQIVPEIFYEIEHSKFVVVDVTFPNHGAYYEAGYAQGLGKQVIVCCKKEVFDNKEGKYQRPHFDISQKSMVIWEDIEDLKVRLKKRIEATVR